MVARKKYLLQDLLTVRRMREEAALKEWMRQKDVVAEADAELVRRKRELRDYKAWRMRRERELFDEIVNQAIHPKDLENLRFKIQKLRDDENVIHAGVIDTEKRLQAERQKLEDTRDDYYEAYRQRDKLDEHKATWIVQENKEQEAWDEKETEDFKNHMGRIAAGCA